MKLPTLSGILKKSSFVWVLSVVIAVMAWFVVINTAPDQERLVTVRNVPVSIPTNALASLGLNIIEGGDPQVAVQVKGRVIQVGNLEPGDIQVTASFTEIVGAGTYDLKLTASTSAGTVVAISPETISMTFDREVNKEIPLAVDINGLSVPENDYILGSVTASPASIVVRGPEKELSRITHAVVHAELEEPLTRSQVIASEIVLMDNEEVVVTSSHVTTDFSSVDITVPVKRKVELPLRVSFINVPEGFPMDELKYTMSNETIVVAAQERSISKATEIIAGAIDFEQLDLSEQSTYTFRVRLPDDFVNVENIENIVVEFDTEGLSSTYLNLNQIYIVNEPSGFKVTSMTQSLYNVKIVGEEKLIKTLKSGDFMVTVDLSDRDVQVGQYEVPVSISAPTRGKVWALGAHTAVINIQ